MGMSLSNNQKARLMFDVFLIIVALVFFFNSLELDFRPWLFPGSFSIILLVMVTIQTGIDWKQMHNVPRLSEPSLAEPMNEPSDKKRTVAVEGQYARLGIAVVSMLVFYSLFRFATIYLAIPVLCVLLLRYLGGRSWRTTGILALGMDAFVYVCFQLLLQTSL